MSKSLMPNSINYKVEKAVEIIGQFDGVVVALSAGVDSSLVAHLARRALGDRAVAVTAVSESLPRGEIEIAKKVALEIGIRHLIVHTDEIHNPNYTSNPTNRCYYCKETLYRELAETAAELGFQTILDGTQLDDLPDDRPGLRAAQEAGVRSPLLDAGLNKKDVREAARCLGLSVWDKPAMPCLSSRIVHGEEVTISKLSSIGEAELFIKTLTGVKELRVRSQTGQARIEVAPTERHLLFDEGTMDQINQKLTTLGFSRVSLDLGGYRSKAVAATPIEGSALPMLDSAHN